MHVFTVAQRVYEPLFRRFFEPGVEYLIESQNVPLHGQGFRYPTVKLEPMRWEDYGFKTVPSFREGEIITVIRAGGYGDLFYLMPVLASISRKLNGDKGRLVLVTAMKPFPTKVPLTFLEFPCAVTELPQRSVVLNMEDIPGEMEQDAAGSTTRRYALRAGLDEDELVWDPDELFPIEELKRRGEELWNSWHGKKRPRMFVALTASAATRSFPYAFHIASAFVQHAALFVATDTTMPTPFPCGTLQNAFDFMAAVVAADGVVGVDTAPTHLSILLKKPTIAVFGAIPSNLRVPETLKTDVLRIIDVSKTETCPCKLNRPLCPVSQQSFCFALAALARRIVDEITEFIPSLS
ncbi:Glycosyltransferase family 9 (heptosyltransferase) [Candidatus Fervidibacteria bacterium JGI MDM2 JNZ-1-D12]